MQRPKPAQATVDWDRLVDRARSGHPEATEELLTLLAPPVLRAVRLMLGGAHPEQEDIVQEVLLDVVDRLGAFRGECSLGHFAIRIAVRKCVRLRRRHWAVRDWLARWKGNRETLSEAPPSPCDETLAGRRRRLLYELLGELPAPQAETTILQVVLGYSAEEVAQTMSTPINTVRSRLRLAKERLRQRILADPRWHELLEVTLD